MFMQRERDRGELVSDGQVLESGMGAGLEWREKVGTSHIQK